MGAVVASVSVLGERPCLDLVNSGPGDRDALTDPDRAARWLAALAAATTSEPLPVVDEVGRPELERLHLLRGAVRQVLDGTPRASSLAVINQIESEASPSWSLDLDPAGRVVARRRLWGVGVEAVLGVLAADAVDLVRTGRMADVRRCPVGACGRYFLADHHRRRFCTPACAHRVRQAAYYRRSRPDA